MIIKLTNKLDSDEWHLDWSETSFFKNKEKRKEKWESDKVWTSCSSL